MAKLTATEIVRIALIWAEESMHQMVDGCDRDDPYRADVADQLKQMKAYNRRRFGERPDPLAGAKLVSIEEIREKNAEASAALASIPEERATPATGDTHGS